MKNRNRFVPLLFAALCCIVLLAGCGGGGGEASNPVVPQPTEVGTLKINNPSPKTVLKIDDVAATLGQDGTVSVASGTHQFSATRAGYTLTNADEVKTIIIKADNQTVITLKFERKISPLPNGWSGLATRVASSKN